jgi:hypothetical protein
MRAEEIKGLMEAYSKIHETPEVLSEDAEILSERGFPGMTQANVDAVRAKSAAENKSRARIDALRRQRFGSGGAPSAKPAAAAKPVAPKPVTPAAAVKPTATAVPKPAPAAAVKPTATAAPKPAPAPAKPVGSAMDQWAKANPKLAAAKAERDRTRGTSATTNPLMKDMKSSLPAPKAPAPSTATTGFNLARKGVNLAAGVDIFDIVKGYLLDEGYAETEENAMVIMVNMSEEWRESILESCGVHLDEASYSAKAASAGEDIGKPGKQFEKIAKEAGERYGSKERGEKVAGAVLAKLRAKKG